MPSTGSDLRSRVADKRRLSSSAGESQHTPPPSRACASISSSSSCGNASKQFAAVPETVTSATTDARFRSVISRYGFDGSGRLEEIISFLTEDGNTGRASMSGSSKAFAERFGTTLDDAALFLSRMHLVAAEVCDTAVQVRFPRRQAALTALSRGHERSLHSALLAEDSPGLTLPPSATFEPLKPVGIAVPISVGRADSFFRRHTKYALPCDRMTAGGASPDDVAPAAEDVAPMEEEVHCFMVHPTLSVKLNTALRTVRPQGVRRTRALALDLSPLTTHASRSP